MFFTFNARSVWIAIVAVTVGVDVAVPFSSLPSCWDTSCGTSLTSVLSSSSFFFPFFLDTFTGISVSPERPPPNKPEELSVQ